MQDYDFASSGKFVLDVHDALKQAQHLLILHSEDYDSSFWTREEYSDATVFCEDRSDSATSKYRARGSRGGFVASLLATTAGGRPHKRQFSIPAEHLILVQRLVRLNLACRTLGQTHQNQR